MGNWFRSIISKLLVIYLLLLTSPTQANQETAFTLIGISPDLNHIGAMETWTADGSGQLGCSATLYARSEWTVKDHTQIIYPSTEYHEGSKQEYFRKYQAACEKLKSSFMNKHHLQYVVWNSVPLSPDAKSIRGEGNMLSTDAGLNDDYPTLQEYSFSPDKETTYQLSVNSSGSPNALKYMDDFLVSKNYEAYLKNPELAQEELGQFPEFVLKLNKNNGTPTFDPLRQIYSPEKMNVFVSPVSVLYNGDYGALVIIFREYSKGFEGLDYTYRPLMSVEDKPLTQKDAIRILQSTANYIPADVDTLILNPGFKAYQKLLKEPPPLEEIDMHLDTSSDAGRLYWLSLLHAFHPEEYQSRVKTIVEYADQKNQVFQYEDGAFKPISFVKALEAQIAKTRH